MLFQRLWYQLAQYHICIICFQPGYKATITSKYLAQLISGCKSVETCSLCVLLAWGFSKALKEESAWSEASILWEININMNIIIIIIIIIITIIFIM